MKVVSGILFTGALVAQLTACSANDTGRHPRRPGLSGRGAPGRSSFPSGHARYVKFFHADVDQTIVPDASPVVGPGYQPNPQAN